MRVAHVIQRYEPAQLTGSERAFVILCQSLARRTKLEICVVTSDVDKGEGFYDPRERRLQPAKAKIDNVQINRLPVNWLRASLLYLANKIVPTFPGLWRGRLAMAAFGPQLIGLESTIQTLAPDVIHVSPLPMAHVLTTQLVARRLGIPLVVTPTMHFDDPKFLNPMIYQILNHADAIIAHTEFEKDQLTQRGVVAKKISVIPSSYLAESDFLAGEDELFRQNHKIVAEAPIVLFIGSKSYDKGTAHLLEAWSAIRQAVPEAVLVIAGAPTESWKSAKLGKDMTGVVELDYIDEPTKQAALTAASVLAVPSRSESFGMILLEAWARRKPVIGGSAGATRELVDEGVNGYTVEFGAVTELAERLIEVLQHPKKAAVLGLNGYQKVKQFTEQLIVERTVAVYETAARARKQVGHAAADSS